MLFGRYLSVLGFATLCASVSSASVPRYVRIRDQSFIEAKTGNTIVLGGPNVVVKGPPYMPSVSGDTVCHDNTDNCGSNCTTCYTFNQADVDHIKKNGWNVIRLGVVWAGAQPEDTDSLDPAFVERLHAVLNLTDANGLNVVLDNHGDMVGSAGCGNGVPMWFQKQAAPELIGKPLVTDFPYSLVDSINVKKVGGYDHCGSDESKWQAHAGDPNYNLLNECCQAMNSGNPGGLGFTTISQKTMDYVLQPGPGRDKFVRFWTLIAEAVKDHPSAFGAELMNEPMSIRRKWMFDTWRAVAEEVLKIIPDMSVAVCDIGEGSVLPSWVTNIGLGNIDISSATLDYMKKSQNLFYAWHYGDVPTNIKNMQAIGKKWNMPTFATETGCGQFNAAKDANISHSYWHYSCYCDTGPSFGNKPLNETFGACILGWGSGDSNKCV
eukprot:g1408.t1